MTRTRLFAILLCTMIPLAFGMAGDRDDAPTDDCCGSIAGAGAEPLEWWYFAMPVQDAESCRGVSVAPTLYVTRGTIDPWNPPMHGQESHRLMWFVAWTDYFQGVPTPTIFQFDRTHKPFVKWGRNTLDAAGTAILPADIIAGPFFNWPDLQVWFYDTYGVCPPGFG